MRPWGTVWCSGADQQGCLEAHHTEEVCESNDRDLAVATQTTERMCDTGMGVVASIISCLLLITIYILDLTELKIVNIELKHCHSRSFMSYRFVSFFDYSEFFLSVIQNIFLSLCCLFNCTHLL